MNRSMFPTKASTLATWLLPAMFVLLGSLWMPAGVLAQDSGRPGHLERAKIYLAAGDYRRALEACLREVEELPSVESYVYVTYLYHTIDGYLGYLTKMDHWVAVEHLSLNLGARGPEDLIDPPGVLARMAKEIIQGAVHKESDITAAMAARLDEEATRRLWKQQAAWRAERPDDWWAGVPKAWGW